jgi:hypothetical protein
MQNHVNFQPKPAIVSQGVQFGAVIFRLIGFVGGYRSGLVESWQTHRIIEILDS